MDVAAVMVEEEEEGGAINGSAPTTRTTAKEEVQFDYELSSQILIPFFWREFIDSYKRMSHGSGL